MRAWTIIETLVSAAHIGPFHDRPHGHTYRIEARFQVSEKPRDGLRLEDELREAIAPLDHGMLDDVLGRENATAEGVGRFVLAQLLHLDCDRVRVLRQDGPGAEVEP